MAFLYLDTETTGTDRKDQVIEIAYAIDNHPIREHAIRHTKAPNKWVVENVPYARVAVLPQIGISEWMIMLHDDWRKQYRQEDLYLVCANPTFDTRVIQTSQDAAGCLLTPPWHFRVIDLGTAAMLSLGLCVPPSLRETGERLNIPPNLNSHTAGGDVDHLRKCFQALLFRFYSGPITTF